MATGNCVVIASQKGGVGKTTVALNLGYALARRGWKTLLIDADPQGSVGLSVDPSVGCRPGLTEVLAGSESLAAAVLTTRLPELEILSLGGLAPTAAAGWSHALEDGRALGEVLEEARQRWDLVLVDTPPGMGGVTLGALACGDYVIAPLQAEPLAARSVGQLLDVLGTLRERGSSARLAGLILTMVQLRQSESLEVTLEAWRLFPRDLVFEVTVPRDPVFLEASARGLPLALLRDRPPALSAVFDQLAAELEERIGLEVSDARQRPVSLLG